MRSVQTRFLRVYKVKYKKQGTLLVRILGEPKGQAVAHIPLLPPLHPKHKLDEPAVRVQFLKIINIVKDKIYVRSCW